MTRNELYSLDTYTQATLGLPRSSGWCPACGVNPNSDGSVLCERCDVKRRPTREAVPGEPGFLLHRRRAAESD